MKLSYLIPFLLYLLTACHNNQSEDSILVTDARHSIDSVTLFNRQELRFPLDTASNARTQSVCVYPKESPQLMLFHHSSSNIISVYDLKTQKLVSKINFHPEGPNGVGRDIRSMHFHNFDSIFLLSNLGQQLHLLDSAGTLKGKFNLANNSAYALLSTTYPAFLKNDVMYLCSYPPTDRRTTSKDAAIIKLDLLTHEINIVFRRSRQYDRGNWGRHNYSRVSQYFDETRGILIISFPNDHYLYTVDKSNTIKKYYAGAGLLGNLDPVNEDFLRDDEKIYDHEATQGFYSTLFFDPWKRLYYRIAFNPSESLDMPIEFGPPSIVILDKDLKKVGEYTLPKDSYVMASSFVTPDGFCLFNKIKYDANDNYLTYDIFSIQKL